MGNDFGEGTQVHRQSEQQPDLTDLPADLVDRDVSELGPASAELPPLAAFNLVAEFDSPREARDAIVALELAGIDGSKISYLALEPTDAEHKAVDNEVDSGEFADLAKSTARGAGLGTIGGAAVGIVTMIIPGVGPIVGGGILGAALGTAFAGGTVGGIWAGFSHMAASPAWDSTFVAIENGASLVGLHTESRDEIEVGRSALPATSRLFDRDGNRIDQPPA